jgi:lipopolysaccharide/colanic/teichoic acid biosynthesis glycosyltransferase
MLSRVLDIIIGVLGLVALALVLPGVAILLKMDSRGPVFYACLRVGRGGRLFKMYKFRTMLESSCAVGPSVSPQGDPRVTDMGRWLRRTKLNEFPQFWNLLKGDMTLIGPRPEAPDLAADYPPEAHKVLLAKPGLIGPNQILGRNEEEWYPVGADPRQYYLEHILPGKVKNDLEYLAQKSFWRDLKLLVRGVWDTVAGAVSRRHLMDNLTQFAMLGLDIVFCLISFSLAHYIRFEWLPTNAEQEAFLKLLPVAVLARLPVFYYFGFYQTLVRHFHLTDVKRVFDGVLFGSGFFIIVSFLVGLDIRGYGRSVCILDWLLLTGLLVGYRVAARGLYLRRQQVRPQEPVGRRRALILGANDEGIWCHRFLQEQTDPPYEVVGFIDVDPKLQHRRVDGLKVLGDHHHLEVLTKLYKVQEVFLTNGAAAPGNSMKNIHDTCQRLSLTMKRFVPRTVAEVGAGGRPEGPVS